MAHDGGGHKVASVILRFLQLTCGAIVLGLLGRFAYLADDANVSVDGRIIYAMVVAGITIIFLIFICLPFNILFWSFLFDFILFIMWLVAFCLLETRTRNHICSASWYRNYWGFYWGRRWRFGRPGIAVKGAGCSEWRAVLGFSILAWVFHFISGILGIYVFKAYIQVKETVGSVKKQMGKTSHEYPANGQNREPTTMRAAEEGLSPTQPRSEIQ